MPPFDTLTLKDARAKVITPEGYAENELFYNSDHWQGADGWSGPKPNATDAGATEAWALIEAGFVSSNVIREIVDRHVGGVIGHEPFWSLTVNRPLEDGEAPNAQEQVLIDEAEAFLTSLWDERGLHGLMQRAAVYAVLSGRSVVRLFVPPAYIGENGRAIETDPVKMAKRIYAQALSPNQAIITTDEDTQAAAAVWSYTRDEKERVELVFLDESGQTIIRIIDDGEPRDSEPLDLGGRLTMFQIEIPALITAQVRQLQRALNKSLTMMQHNENVAGFTERTLLNAQLPGSFTGTGADRRFIPDPYLRGPGAVNALVGVPTYDASGKPTGVASPSIVDREPSPPDTFILSQSTYYRQMLGETHQRHALISGDATASGESRKQALTDFAASLRETQTALERLGRWLLETYLAMAAAYAGQAGRYAGLRAVVACRVDTGPVSADEQRLALEQYTANAIDWQGFAERIGVADPDAMRARLEQEAAERAERAPTFAPVVTSEEGGEDGQN